MSSKPTPAGEQKRTEDDGNARLRRSVEQAVPATEQLPSGAAENPLSRHVRDIAEGQEPGPGRSPMEGGDESKR